MLLIPAVGTSLLVTFAARNAMERGCRVAPLALFSMMNSLLVAGLVAVFMAPRELFVQMWRPETIWIALFGGAAGAAGLCLSYPALRQRATGPVTTITSMSVLVPVLLAFFADWDTPPGPAKVAGAALTLCGVAAINLGKSPLRHGERFHWIWLAVGAMFCFGVSQAAQKYITVVQPGMGNQSRWVFMATYYLACTLTLGGYLLLTSQRIEWRAWPFAVCLSAGSLIQFACMLVLLQHVSTALVYVTFTGAGIVLIMLVSAWAIGERYTPAVWIGCLLGIVGIVMMRL